MASSRFDEARDYTFADQALALRKRAGLTQREVAALLGVSGQSIHAWEAGLSYPGAERLKQLITFYLERGAFAGGREEDEAAVLWATVREKATRRMTPFDVTWFAALRRANAAPPRSPSNLLPARTTFVGRRADLVALSQALDPATNAGMRLLTLSGVAGCGKTRLALAVADTVRGAYSDGTWLVELASLPAGSSADPTPVATATLTALRVREQAGRAPLDTLVAHLESRRLLLVLDNCEHVAPACAALTARLLGAGPEVRILATSQHPLGTADETVWWVATLTVPAPVEGMPAPAALEALRQSDAVRLFLERAQAVQPGFALSATTGAGVAAICRRLNGLPLAIELAAARLHVLPLEDVLARLDDCFRLLRRGGRTATDRHHTLQATMDWSYGLLDPAEQAVLRRLAVFAGGWEVASAEAVCAGESVAAEAVLELLDELLDRSLVSVYEVNGAPRYEMLETVRQYGAQQLERAGETAGVRDRRLAWCVTLAEQAAPALLGPEQIAWLARLDREHDNLRAAMRWALDRGQYALGLRVAAGLWQFWRNRGYLSEGRSWLAAFLAQTATNDGASADVQVSALEGAAWLAEDEHDFTRASTLFAECDALRQALGQNERVTGLLINAAMEARAGGDYTRATQMLDESLARHRALGNRANIMSGGLGLSLTRLALVLGEQGHYARAQALYEECLALHGELGDREGVGSALLGLSDIARDQGDAARVRAYGEECLAIFREYGLKWAIGFALNNLALAAHLDGEVAQAARCAEESLAIFRGLRAWPSLAEVLITLGRVTAARGDAEAARAHLVEAFALSRAEGPRLIMTTALEELAVQAVRRDRARQAVHVLGATAMLRRAMGTPVRPASRPTIERALAAARLTLGATAFTDAWATGQTLPVEQIGARLAATPEDTAAQMEQHGARATPYLTEPVR